MLGHSYIDGNGKCTLTYHESWALLCVLPMDLIYEISYKCVFMALDLAGVQTHCELLLLLQGLMITRSVGLGFGDA